MRICNSCKKKMFMDGFSTGNCKCCGKTFTSTHTPADKLCHECSIKKPTTCKVCGEEF